MPYVGQADAVHGDVLFFRCDRQTVLPKYHLTHKCVFDFYQREVSLSLSRQHNTLYKPFLANLLLNGYIASDFSVRK